MAKQQSTQKLIAKALEQEAPSQSELMTMVELWKRDNLETFLLARDLCRSKYKTRQSLGIRILSFLGTVRLVDNKLVPSDRRFKGKIVEFLLSLMEEILNTDTEFAKDIMGALAMVEEPRVVPLVVHLKHWPDPVIRRALIDLLLHYENELAIRTLLELNEDQDESVRNAVVLVFGCVYASDTPAIRNVLLRHLDDPDPNVRQNAIIGLAWRCDPRGFLALERGLENGEFRFTVPGKAAPARIINVDLRPALLKLKARNEEAGVVNPLLEAALAEAPNFITR